MKYIILIGDGMADNPVPALGGKTPLEVSKHPNMDRLAQRGTVGRVKTVPDGIAPGSDTAILTIFGYDPRKFYSGRAPLEAAGAGVSLEDGDVSYRCNMIALSDDADSFDDKKILSHSGGSVDGESAIALMTDLLADKAFSKCAAENGMTFHLSPSFRHIAVQKDTDVEGLVAPPPHDHLDEAAGPNLPHGGSVGAGLVDMMRLAHQILDGHPINQKRRAEGKLPANGIWFWAEGTAIALPQFNDIYGMDGFVVSAVPLVRGIGALAGLNYVIVDGATGELETNYEGKTEAVLKGLKEGKNFAVLHVEAPDECTHNGDTEGKLQAIEWIDERTLRPLLEGLDATGEEYRILILSDHKTLTATRSHDADPVPYLLYDSRDDSLKNANTSYTEAFCEKGDHLDAGHELIGRLFEKY